MPESLLDKLRRLDAEVERYENGGMSCPMDLDPETILLDALPQILELIQLLKDYKSEYENIMPDAILKQNIRERMFSILDSFLKEADDG